jgi:hypothetical protein
MSGSLQVRQEVSTAPHSGGEAGMAVLDSEDLLMARVARLSISSWAPLHDLDRMLRASDAPLPAAAIILSTRDAAKHQATTVHYGHTVTGEALRPVKHVKLPGQIGREVTFGLALPIDGATQQSASYVPYEYAGKTQSVAAPAASGFWNHWQSDRFTLYKPNEEPQVIDYRNGEVSFNDQAFSTWPSPADPITSPLIMADVAVARDEATRAVSVVRELPYYWRVLHEKSGYTRQHFIVVGQEAVKAAFEVLQERPTGGPDIPQPLTDMLGKVASDLGVEL